MEDGISPFVTKDVACPVCLRPSPQRFFRQRAFTIERRESDQHPTQFHWPNERMRQVHPPWYFVFYCPHCGYADASDEYAKAGESEHGTAVVRAVRQLDDERRFVVRALASRINYVDITFDSALCLHLLALYLHSLPEEDVRNSYKLARISLRVAWLYREAAGAVPARSQSTARLQQDAAAPAPVSDVQEMREADAALAALTEELQRRIADIGACLVGLSETLERRRSLAREAGFAEPARKCTEALRTLADAADAQREGLRQLQQALERARAHEAVLAKRAADLGAVNEDTHAFLGQLAKTWLELPRSEHDAMRGAIAWFQDAIVNDPRLSSHETYYSTVLLVADLLVRCDDYPAALAVIGGVYRSGMDARRAYQRQLEREGITEAEARRIQGRISRVNASLERTGEFRADLLDAYLKREKPRIAALVEERPRASLAELEQLLVDAGYAPELIRRLKRAGGPLHRPARTWRW